MRHVNVIESGGFSLKQLQYYNILKTTIRSFCFDFLAIILI